MIDNTAHLIEADDSDRPTLIPPGKEPSFHLDTADVDATWPGEAPRHSFIAERAVSPEDVGSAPEEARRLRPPVSVGHRNGAPAGAPAPADDSAIIRMTPEPGAPAAVPPMDTYEDERALLAFIELPGVAPDSLVIELSNVALHIRGVVAEDPRRQLPLSSGRREIVIDVPRGTEAEAVDASLRNGLLRVRVDKTGATTRHVEIAHSEA
jgi:HSP20 family molecular chaperone IbpA